MAKHGIAPIDLLILNLYPFEQITAKKDCTLADAVDTIDIGGPAMLRSAAKNFARVAVATSPDQYPDLLAELQEHHGQLSAEKRFALAVAAFNHVAQYDAAISNYLSSVSDMHTTLPLRHEFPAQLNNTFVKMTELRYGKIRIKQVRSTAMYIRNPGRWPPSSNSKARDSATTTSSMPTPHGNAYVNSKHRPASSSNMPTLVASQLGWRAVMLMKQRMPLIRRVRLAALLLLTARWMRSL